MYADTRAAWTGPIPGMPGETQRIEAGSYRGRPVYFHPVAAWTTTSRMADTIAARRRVTFMGALIQTVVIGMFVAAGLIARHNWRKGRGDRRGAVQLTVFITLAAVGVWLIDTSTSRIDAGDDAFLRPAVVGRRTALDAVSRGRALRAPLRRYPRVVVAAHGAAMARSGTAATSCSSTLARLRCAIGLSSTYTRRTSAPLDAQRPRSRRALRHDVGDRAC
jgi:hypothetical protein